MFWSAFLLGAFQILASYLILWGFGFSPIKNKSAYAAVFGIVVFIQMTDFFGYRVGALRIPLDEAKMVYGSAITR